MTTPFRMAGMKAYTNDEGIRDYRAAVERDAVRRTRWDWILWLVVGVILGLLSATQLLSQ